MSHNHHHHNSTARDIRFAFVLNLVFTIIEIGAGIWTNSLAILADALHDFGDSLSLGASWYLERYSNKEMDAKFSYGYRRFSLLGALISTLVIVVGSIIILAGALPRLLDPQPTDVRGMILISLLGIAVNGLAVLRLRGGRTINARVVTWHLLEDVLGWAAILVVSIVLLFTDAYILDPILAIMITVYVLYNILRYLRKTLSLFLQGVPDNVDIDEISEQLLAIEFVTSSHHTHVWSLDGEHHVLTTHLVIDPCATKDDILSVKKDAARITSNYDFEHTTVEIELEDEDCSMSAPIIEQKAPTIV